MHVYLQERVDIAPGQVEAYYAQLDTGARRLNDMIPRCMGLFHTVGATGKWHEVYFLWEFDDWAQYAKVMERYPGPGGIVSWADPDWKLRTGGSSITMEPGFFCPTLHDLQTQGLQARVFMHEYIRVLPGRRNDYLNHYHDNFLEATQRVGRELVGVWSMTGNANDVVILLAIKDWSAYAKGMAIRKADPVRKTWQATSSSYRSDYDLRLLAPGPLSFNPLAW